VLLSVRQNDPHDLDAFASESAGHPLHEKRSDRGVAHDRHGFPTEERNDEVCARKQPGSDMDRVGALAEG
jgi:hypothetical protein